jgi:hypothetical protein
MPISYHPDVGFISVFAKETSSFAGVSFFSPQRAPTAVTLAPARLTKTLSTRHYQLSVAGGRSGVIVRAECRLTFRHHSRWSLQSFGSAEARRLGDVIVVLRIQIDLKFVSLTHISSSARPRLLNDLKRAVHSPNGHSRFHADLALVRQLACSVQSIHSRCVVLPTQLCPQWHFPLRDILSQA